MLTLTPAALAAVRNDYMDQALPLRLEVSPRGCGAPVVALSPGVLQEEDILLAVEGRTFIIAAPLYEKTRPITLDACNGRYSVALGAPYTVSGCGVCPASPLQGGRCGVIDGMNF